MSADKLASRQIKSPLTVGVVGVVGAVGAEVCLSFLPCPIVSIV